MDVDEDSITLSVTTLSENFGPVYDIISSEGQLVNRLQLPPGYTIVGFGKGKIVYLSMRDTTGIHLARVRLR